MLALALAAPSAGADHVRVVLDLSQSMQGNDPGKLAILSTLLLFDLARPNPTLDDSFEVIPFARDWEWRTPQAPPPTGTGPRISARFDRRAELVAQLDRLRYEARNTYFYPGLLAAVEDLERTSGGAYDARTIVLVTDGVPEKATRDAELRRIEADLSPRLASNGIRLYVLAFGGEADANRDFFGRIVRAPDGSSLGGFFVDPRGRDLLGYMLQIFSGSFGFTADTAHPLPGTTRLDLEAATTPLRVAVVVLSPRVQPPPRLRLTPPPAGAVNQPEAVSSASEPGGSYSVTWVLSPTPGDYGLDSDADPGSVALLRPTRLQLDVLPMPPHRQADRTLARAPFPMRVRVSSPGGGLGDPGPVDLSYRTLGARIATESGAVEHTWASDLAAPPPGAGTRTPEGRVYEIVPTWRDDPHQPGRTYAGYLEVEARRGRAVVGALVAEHAHRVDVHPPLSIVPFPLSSYLTKGGSSGALGRRDRACTRFGLSVEAGRLPHPETPSYSLRAALVAKDPGVADGELRQAVVTVDGQPLDLPGRPAAPPAPWTLGRTLTAGQLLGQHELCLQVGKPRVADPSRPLELAVAFTLQEDPYDDFDVIRRHAVKVRIAPPTFLQRWQLLLVSALSSLAVVALLWYLRDRPDFPRDLGYVLVREGSPTLHAPAMPAATPLRRLLGLATRGPVVATEEDLRLGTVLAVDEELFRFRPARGVTVEPWRDRSPVVLQRGAASLAVHRAYRLRAGQRSYYFRLEYQ